MRRSHDPTFEEQLIHSTFCDFSAACSMEAIVGESTFEINCKVMIRCVIIIKSAIHHKIISMAKNGDKNNRAMAWRHPSLVEN